MDLVALQQKILGLEQKIKNDNESMKRVKEIRTE